MTDQTSKAEARSRQNTILIAVAIGVIGTLSLVLYLVPWVTTEVDIGFSDEARRNPYLAAEDFLGRFDVTVKTENGLALLDELPSTDDTLLFASSRLSLSERRVDAITDWVYDGGALIVLASDLYDEDREDKGDRLLNRFGVWLYEGEAENSENDTDTLAEIIAEADVEPTAQVPEEAPEEAPEETKTQSKESDSKARKSFGDILRGSGKPTDRCLHKSGLTSIDFEGEPQELQARLSSRRHLYFEDDQEYAYAANDTGAQFVYVPHGQGSIYVLTTLNQWRNRNIGCFDHAHFLRVLTENTSTLWLMFNTDIEPLHLLIWKHWPVAVFLAFIWLALWLWRSAYRSTRIESENPSERREVMEHIDGMSRFLYQQNELQLLLSGLRADCFNGNPKEPKNQERLAQEISRWAQLLNINEKRIHWALTADIGRDGNALTKAVALLQKIRDSPKTKKA